MTSGIAEFRLDGRVGLVTGANHGIGAATARGLAERGAAVVVTFQRVIDEANPAVPAKYREARSQNADEVVNVIRGAGGTAEAIEADLRDPLTASVLFDFAEATVGPADILVNNATGWVADTFKIATADRLGRSLRRVSSATIDQQFGVDARGGALLIAEFARRIAGRGSRWGRIVSIVSGGPDGFPEEASYGAAKAALLNYTMTAARELVEYGVTANTIYPPVTDTGWITDELRRQLIESAGYERIATPSEVAEVIIWLASESAGLVTGNAITLH